MPPLDQVFLNGKQLPVRDFKSYIDLFLGPKQAPDAIPRVFEKVGDRWEVAVAASDDGFTQVRLPLGWPRVASAGATVLLRPTAPAEPFPSLPTLSLTALLFTPGTRSRSSTRSTRPKEAPTSATSQTR